MVGFKEKPFKIENRRKTIGSSFTDRIYLLFSANAIFVGRGAENKKEP